MAMRRPIVFATFVSFQIGFLKVESSRFGLEFWDRLILGSESSAVVDKGIDIMFNGE